MREVITQGQYTHKETGQVVNYEFSYPVFDSLQDAIDSLGEDKVLKDLQRQVKVDANNVTREKVKAKNGHSSRPIMSEEEKAQKKAERAEQRELAKIAQAKGLTPEKLQELLASL